MKENSYDGLGIRFGLLTIPSLEDKIHTDKLLEKCKYPEEIGKVFNKELRRVSKVIDFNNFDGLTLKELFQYDIFNEDYLFFIVYSKVDMEDYDICKFLSVDVLAKDKIKNLDESVDSYLANYLTNIYNKKDERGQQFIKNFLERYKYSSKEKVDKHLRRANLKLI